MATGLLNFITDYRFLYTSHFMKDVLMTLNILSKIFQRWDLTVSELAFQLKAAVSALHSMKTVPEPFLQTFITNLPEHYSDGFQHGLEGQHNHIKCSPNLVTLTRTSLEKYFDAILKNLSE